MLRIALLALALLAPFNLTAQAAPKALAPVDEAAKDPQLAALIAELLKACDEKNFKPFEAAISPNATASFGGDIGVKGFKDAYGIDQPGTTFYADFKAALTMGGAFMEDGLYAAPYVYAKWPEDLDSFTYVVGIGPKTQLYDSPKPAAKVTADVTHKFLELIETDPESPTAPPEGWIHVKAGKKTGYVKSAEVAGPIGYRAIFQKTENRWWIGAFVAGD